MPLNDQILSINQTNYTTLTQEQYCEILKEGLLPKVTIPVQIEVRRKKEALKIQNSKIQQDKPGTYLLNF